MNDQVSGSSRHSTVLHAAAQVLCGLAVCWTAAFGESSRAATSIPSGWGTPAIDGIYKPAEWQGAGVVNLFVRTPGGGTTAATLYVMNDALSIYLMLRVLRSPPDLRNSLAFTFDKDGDGDVSIGDDLILLNVDSAQVTAFHDEVLAPCCGGGAINGQFDTDFGGTNDGGGAFGYDNAYSVFQLWHPLKSSDSAHDVQLSPGQSIGLNLFLRMIDASNNIADTTTQFMTFALAPEPTVRSAPIPTLTSWGIVILVLLIGIAYHSTCRRGREPRAGT